MNNIFFEKTLILKKIKNFFFKKKNITYYPQKKSKYPPVFLHGLSRSGTTLLTAILDSHPQISMSYELYPHLLKQRNSKNLKSNNKVNKDASIYEVMDYFEKFGENFYKNIQKLNHFNLKTFFYRAERSDLDIVDFKNLLKNHLDQKKNFDNIQFIYDFIEQICLTKMYQENKKIWGCKATSDFDEYLNQWPDAIIIYIVRDGRDVVASQKFVGNWNLTPLEIGRQWNETANTFNALLSKNKYLIFYEDLVQDPEREVISLCNFLNIEFSRTMLDFYKKELSIFKNPRGALSLKQISKPINDFRIGRWKKDLTEDEIKKFMKYASQNMIEFGYI